MTREDYLAIPYVLGVESFRAADGEWLRRAYFPELPGCIREGVDILDVIERLEELRVRIIEDMLDRGEPVPVPRPPLRVRIPAVRLTVIPREGDLAQPGATIRRTVQ